MRWCALGLVLVVGCYPAARQPRALPPVADVQRWVDEAKARLDTALRTTEARRVLAQLDPDATIVVRGRDSIVGAEAVVRALRNDYEGVGVPSLFMLAPQREACADGVYEYEGSLGVQVVSADRAPRLVDFRYAAKWAVDGRRVRLRRLALAPPESEAGPSEALCPSRSVVEFPQRRLVVTFMSSLFSVQTNRSRANVASFLQGQGFAVTDVRDPIELGFASESDIVPWGTVAIRARVGGGVSVEAYWALDDAWWNAQVSATVTGQARLSNVQVRSRPSGALVGYEWDRWRVAAGIAVSETRIRWLDYVNGLTGGGARVLADRATGGTVLVGWARPLSGALVAELRLQHTFAIDAALPAIAGSQPGRVSLGGTTAGLYVGFAAF